ncbi:helix-turn-helix transcriptional regulator [bacterium]|nr:helix-turn-helix transcriptional regulator [bacterium]
MEKSIYSGNYAYLIHILVRKRKQYDISQIALANSLGKPQSFISKIEIRERRLDVIEFIEICFALGINPKTVFNELIDNWIINR